MAKTAKVVKKPAKTATKTKAKAAKPVASVKRSGSARRAKAPVAKVAVVKAPAKAKAAK